MKPNPESENQLQHPREDTDAILNRRRFLIQAALASAGVGAGIVSAQAAEPQPCLTPPPPVIPPFSQPQVCLSMALPPTKTVGQWGPWRNNKRGPIARVTYPRGEEDGAISQETELFQERDPQTGEIKEVEGKTYEWRLAIDSTRDEQSESFWVANKVNSDRKFAVEQWELLKDGKVVLKSKGAQKNKFTVTYREPGTHEVVASGKTLPLSVPFKVRIQRTRPEPRPCLSVPPPRVCLSIKAPSK